VEVEVVGVAFKEAVEVEVKEVEVDLTLLPTDPAPPLAETTVWEG
jgi:hypothetical protein